MLSPYNHPDHDDGYDDVSDDDGKVMVNVMVMVKVKGMMNVIVKVKVILFMKLLGLLPWKTSLRRSFNQKLLMKLML